MVRLVAFTGPAGCGKDTCGAFLVRDGWVRLSFATPMYRMLQAAGFGWPKTQEEKERLIPDIGVTWRHLAQTLGTEWGRNQINTDLWVLLAKRTIQQNPQNKYVITDLRFENEAMMIRELGGHIIHLVGRKFGTGNDAHASEAGIKALPGEWFINNGGELDELYTAIDNTLVTITHNERE